MGAPLPSVPNVIRAVLNGFTDNTKLFKWANVLHFLFGGGPPTAADLLTLGGKIAQAWLQHMAPACPSPTTLDNVDMTDLSSPQGAQAVATAGFAGTRGDDSIPANAAMLVQYPSAIRYKGGHPRTYLYVLGNADLTGSSEWTQLATGEVQGDWISFLQACESQAAGSTSMGSFCSIRYRGKFLPNSGPPHYYLNTPIVNVINPAAAVCDRLIASQKGRIGRRAE